MKNMTLSSFRRLIHRTFCVLRHFPQLFPPRRVLPPTGFISLRMALTLVSTSSGGPNKPPRNCLARLIQSTHEVLIDSLPYLDKEYDNPRMKDMVDRGLKKRELTIPCSMIDEEMDLFEPREYLSSMPAIPPVKFPEGSAMREELDRITQFPKSKLTAIDMARYHPSAPQGEAAKNIEEWQKALGNARTALEYANIRAGNVELMNQYGVNAWRALNSSLEDTNVVYKKKQTQERLKTLEVNRKRQAAQLGAASKLQRLEDKYITNVHKNMRLEAQCRALEQEVEKLEKSRAL